MKLDIFNPWKDLVSLAGRTLQYQTSRKGNTFVTYIRDKESKHPILSGFGTSKEASQQTAQANLKKVGVEGVLQAVKTGEPVKALPRNEEPRKEVDWRDGANHRHRAAKRMVDKGFPG